MKRRYASRQPAAKSARTTSAAKATSASVARATVTPAKSAPAGLPRFLKPSSAPVKKPDLTRQPAVVRSALQQPGQPLDAGTRRTMEKKFQRDLSAVRIHASPVAARSAQALRAEAYTLGSHIVFGPGRYAPASPDGRRLLAHELTHVVQQTLPGQPATAARLEAQADRSAAQLTSASPATTLSAAPLEIQRKRLSQTDDVLPSPGDFLTVPTGGEGDFTYIFYIDQFKVIKFLEGQTGPSWICNNPGNLTFKKELSAEDKQSAHARALQRHCLENHAFADELPWGPRSFAIFPYYETGRTALTSWIAKILNPAPTDPDLKSIPVADRPNSISKAIATYAPASDGKNRPGDYTTAVTKSINDARAKAGRDAVNPSAAVSVGEGTGAQTLTADDLKAWSYGSATVEGSHAANSWQIDSESDFLPAEYFKAATAFGRKIPMPAQRWCQAFDIPLKPFEKPK